MKQSILFTIILSWAIFSVASNQPDKNRKAQLTCLDQIIKRCYASGECVKGSALIFLAAVRDFNKQMFPDPSDSSSDSESD